MSQKEVLIIDYGMGNIWSVASAFSYVGAKVTVSSDPDEVIGAKKLVLPGVGSFRRAMEVLREKSLDQAIVEAVSNRGANILGICLGMQLMGDLGSEDGKTKGLSFISASVDRFSEIESQNRKVPHIGFNEVKSSDQSKLFSGIQSGSDFYFVHSYRMLAEKLQGIVSSCSYGVNFVAGYENGNIFATQFHPEKSQGNGLRLLNNYLNIDA